MTTKNLTVLSVSVALQIVLLLISLLMPTIKISMLFAASLLNGLLCSAGYKKRHVFMSFIAVGILSFVFIPNYIIPASYALFFGGYGIIHFATISQNTLVKQLLRFAYLAFGLAILYFVFKAMFSHFLFFTIPYIYFLPFGIIAGYLLFQKIYDLVIKEFYRHKSLHDLIV